jgi:outer membrane protein assembly factor BamB
MTFVSRASLVALAALGLTAWSVPVTPGQEKTAPARSWPMLGGSPQRNMANTVEKDLPGDWSIKKGQEKNVKWVAQLGTMSFGGPVVAGGRIFVGTNNGKPRDPAIKGDKGVVMCFRESDGTFLWQIVHDMLPEPDLMDAANHGVCSSPVVEGDRLYYVSNRCELVCADVKGDEAKKKGKILWSLDMIKELKVYPAG